MTPRTAQLGQFWRIAMARHTGQPDAVLPAIDQHILYYNALGKGDLIGARTVHDRWAATVRHT